MSGAVCVALLCAGCSGVTSGHPELGARTSSPASSSPIAPAGGSPSAAAAAKLSTIPVRESDLPAGWQSKPPDTAQGAQDDKSQAQIAACLGVRNTVADRLGRVYSPAFSSGTVTVDSDAELYRSTADVDTDVSMFGKPNFTTCYDRLVHSELATDLPGTTVSGVRTFVRVGAGAGPRNVVATLTLIATVTNSGGTATLFVSETDIRGKNVQCSVTFTGVNSPVNAAVQVKAIDAVAARAADA